MTSHSHVSDSLSKQLPWTGVYSWAPNLHYVSYVTEESSEAFCKWHRVQSFRSSDAGRRFSFILHTHCRNVALCLCMQDQAVCQGFQHLPIMMTLVAFDSFNRNLGYLKWKGIQNMLLSKISTVVVFYEEDPKRALGQIGFDTPSLLKISQGWHPPTPAESFIRGGFLLRRGRSAGGRALSSLWGVVEFSTRSTWARGLLVHLGAAFRRKHSFWLKKQI